MRRIAPFGYQMLEGSLVMHAEEAMVVRGIFEDYAEGASYQKLADSVNRRDCILRQGKLWDKHRIKRVLDHERYTGSHDAPQIVAPGLFHRAKAVQKSKTAGYRKAPPEIRSIRDRVICGECGARVYRRTHRNGHILWGCCKECEGHGVVNDVLLLQTVTALLEWFRFHPGIPAPGTPHSRHDVERIRSLERAIQKELHNPDMSSGHVLELIFSSARERYGQCVDDYVLRKNAEIQVYLRARENHGGFDDTLFRIAVKHVRVFQDDQVGLELFTGNEIPYFTERR